MDNERYEVSAPKVATRRTRYPELLIDLQKCEVGDPCTDRKACRIHRIRIFLVDLGWVEAIDVVESILAGSKAIDVAPGASA
jgi:hypothetical protein